MLITNEKRTEYGTIMILSAWSFVIVMSSFLFLYIGYWIDKTFNTAPSFMFGLFLIGVILCIGRLYRDAWVRIPRR